MNQNNYETAKIKARPYFLEKNQEEMIRRNGLKHDHSYLYLTFLYAQYRIERKTGAVEREADKDYWVEADYEETLSIYDLLGYGNTCPTLSHKWSVVNSLPGVAQTSGLGDHFFSKYEEIFSSDETAFICACEALGGERADCGDVGFLFHVFKELPILMKIYRADDEFDAQITLLWDRYTLNYVRYETTYYIVNVLFRRILEHLEDIPTPSDRQ